MYLSDSNGAVRDHEIDSNILEESGSGNYSVNVDFSDAASGSADDLRTARINSSVTNATCFVSSSKTISTQGKTLF